MRAPTAPTAVRSRFDPTPSRLTRAGRSTSPADLSCCKRLATCPAALPSPSPTTVELIDVDVVDGADDDPDERAQLLHDEDLAGTPIGRRPSGRQVLHAARGGLAFLLDRGDVRSGLGFLLGLVGRGRGDDVGVELQTGLFDTGALDVHLGRGARDLSVDGALFTGHFRRASGPGGDDAFFRFGVGEGAVGLELRDLGRKAFSGLLHLRRRRLVGLGLAGVADELRAAGPTDRVEVADFVGHGLDLQRVQAQPQRLQVDLRFLDQLGGELLLVLVDLLRGQLGQHAAQVALERLAGELDDLFLATCRAGARPRCRVPEGRRRS